MKRVFAIKDIKAEAFWNPVYYVSEGVAVREFEMVVAQGDSVLAKVPEDFVLYELGAFDEETGEHVNHERPLPVCTAREIWERHQSRLAEFAKAQ